MRQSINVFSGVCPHHYLKINHGSITFWSLSIALHIAILSLFFLNLDAKFLPQQIVNVQLNAFVDSENKETHEIVDKDIASQKVVKNINKAKNIEAVESKAIYNAEYLNNPAPLYPPLAKSRGIEGKVMLEVLVSDKGEALKVKIISSSGSNLLDESAFEAVANWKFIPAQKFGKNVEARIVVPIEFKII